MALNNQIMFVLTVFLLFHCADSWSTSTACEGRTLSISCPRGKFIDILNAVYGRDRGPHVCPSHAIRVTSGCKSTTSLSVVWDLCQSKHSCSVHASNGVFGNPCARTHKFLRVEYECRSNFRRVRACENTNFHLQCTRPERRLRIIGASYGRNAGPEVCPHSSIRQLSNCRASSSRSVVDNACDGRRGCNFRVSNNVFGDPCPNTYKYLEVKFWCD